MLIDLDHPIWAQLYGPYGVEDVPGQLRTLLNGWDYAIAQDLFFERLHHQETLYPVTFAALPWLVEIAENTPEAKQETVSFISWVLQCALADPDGVGPQFCGTIPTEMDGYWAEANTRLQKEFGSLLDTLADWFKTEAPSLSDLCLETAKACDADAVGYMLCGPAVVRGAPQLSLAIQSGPLSDNSVTCLECGKLHFSSPEGAGFKFEPRSNWDFGGNETVDLGPIPNANRERDVARGLAEEMREAQPDMARFLTALAEWRCCDS